MKPYRAFSVLSHKANFRPSFSGLLDAFRVSLKINFLRIEGSVATTLSSTDSAIFNFSDAFLVLKFSLCTLMTVRWSSRIETQTSHVWVH